MIYHVDLIDQNVSQIERNFLTFNKNETKQRKTQTFVCDFNFTKSMASLFLNDKQLYIFLLCIPW
jgi:hypothetical protein